MGKEVANKTLDNEVNAKTTFSEGKRNLPFKMLDFWEFQFGNIYTLQDEIAEFLISRALDIRVPYNKSGWTLWDFNYRNIKIEVKETGYFYPWQKLGPDGKHKINKRRAFSIAPAYSIYKNRRSEYKRQSDIYIFCVNNGETEEDSYPLDVTNWSFYVVPTKRINELCKPKESSGKLQKTISLNRIKKLTKAIAFNEIKKEVDAIIDHN